MIRYLRKYATLLVCSLLSAELFCSSLVDSGGGLDIGNPTEVSVVDAHNRPVKNATVRIIATEFWIDHALQGNDATAKVAVTDNNGKLKLDSLEAGSYNIQVDHADGGAFITGFSTADSLDSLNIAIREYGTLSGTINSTTNTPLRINLAGSAYSATVEGDGSYMLENVAGSTFVPVVMSIDSLWTITPPVSITSSAVSVYNRNVSFTAFLIEDFEDLSNTSGVGGLLRRDGTYTKSNQGIAEYVIVPDDSSKGNVLEALLVREGSYSLVGLSIGYKSDGDSLWDLSDATGFSFYGKGTGKLNISFESDTLDKLGFIKHYSADIVVVDEWRHITISFDTLSIYPDDNPNPELPWSVCAKSVKRIEFNALEGDTARFRIDDLAVEGTDFSGVY